MYSNELKKLIEDALTDGVLTDKERSAIKRRAMKEGVDPDEIEIYLDAELHKRTTSFGVIHFIKDTFKEPSDGELTDIQRVKMLFMLIVILSVILIPIFCIGIYFEDKKNSTSIGSYESYQEAARAHDFEAAHKILDKMLEEYHNKKVTPYSDRWFASNKRHNKESQEKYEMKAAYDEGVKYVFDAELLYLCSLGDKESADRIVFLMSENKISELPISDRKFNETCDKVIDLAITNHSIQIVKAILPLYKSIPNYKDKDNAIKKINKAIDDGVFPNVTEHIK